MDNVEIVVAHAERATLRVGGVFLKVDGDGDRLRREVAAMQAAPVPTPRVLWHRPPVLALAALRGRALGRLGEPSPASPSQWAAAGAVVRALHDAPVPEGPGPGAAGARRRLDFECERLVAEGILPADLVARNREVAQAALAPSRPALVHGDLQIAHVFVDGDEVTGILDWSEAGRGDAMADLATLTLGHEERLDELVAGYGADAVDREAIRGWWSLRSLTAIRWLIAHGFDPAAPSAEVDVLRARMREG